MSYPVEQKSGKSAEEISPAAPLAETSGGGRLNGREISTDASSSMSFAEIRRVFELPNQDAQGGSEPRRVYCRANTVSHIRRPKSRKKDLEEAGPSSRAAAPSLSPGSSGVSLRLDLEAVKEALAKDNADELRRISREISEDDSPPPQKRREHLRRTSSMSSLQSRQQVSHPELPSAPMSARETHFPLLSSRSSGIGDYFSPHIAHSASEVVVRLEELSFVKQSKISSFDNGLRAFLQKAWKKAKKPDISPQEIEESVGDFCRREVDDLFEGEHEISSSALQISESPRTKFLLGKIQLSGIPLIAVVQRLKIIKKMLDTYLSLKMEKSPWAVRLSQTLNELIVADQYIEGEASFGLQRGKDLRAFMRAIEDISGRRGDKPIAEIVHRAFGDKAKTRKQVFASLQKWVSPPKDLVPNLKRFVHQKSWENIAAMNIPFHQHEWAEAEDAQYPVRDTTLAEIVRCFATDNAIIMNTIVINGVVLHDAAKDGFKKCSQEEFLNRLLFAIYQSGLDPQVQEERIEREVEAMINSGKARKSSSSSSTTSSSDEPVNVGCAHLLKLCTMSAWGHCDKYFRDLFPGLFISPYWTKLMSGIDCSIRISGPDQYSVSISKRYGVYPLLNPENKESWTVDRERLLAEIPVEWTLYPSPEGLKGTLVIPRPIDILPITSYEDKWKILLAVINFTDFESGEAASSPGTPRMRSSPRLPIGREAAATPRRKVPEPLETLESPKMPPSEEDDRKDAPRASSSEPVAKLRSPRVSFGNVETIIPKIASSETEGAPELKMGPSSSESEGERGPPARKTLRKMSGSKDSPTRGDRIHPRRKKDVSPEIMQASSSSPSNPPQEPEVSQ